MAHKTGALRPRISSGWWSTPPRFSQKRLPTRLTRGCALDKLVDLAKRNNVPLRQSYVRVAKRAAIMVGRYTHAHQFKRARRALKFLRTRLGRAIRDIRRKAPVGRCAAPGLRARPNPSPDDRASRYSLVFQALRSFTGTATDI